jgi:Ca2+-binding RTX toxin-like protein
MAVTDTSAGFKYEGRLGGGPDLIREFLFKDTETLTKGDLANLEAGEVDLAATDDTALVGAVRETKAGTDSTTLIEVYWAPDAVYSVYDPNARLFGVYLDLAGTTGAMTIAAKSNEDLIVVGGLGADERTQVMIAALSHFLTQTPA